jgi:phage tail-like protein
MSFSNTDYLYAHLPARVVRDDDGEFLKKFLTWFGTELDGVDQKFDTFWGKIQPSTAPEEFIQWWLWALFGWGWFPKWFKGDELRSFYAAFAQHLARRGTVRGIREFLLAFGVHAIVEARPRFWGESYWGESGNTIVDPLGIVIRILPQITGGAFDELRFWGESYWGDATPATPTQGITRADIEMLIRFQWPVGNLIFVEWLPIAPGQSTEDLSGLDLYGDPLFGG